MFSETVNPGFGGRQRVICATKRSWRSSHSSSLMFTKQGTVYLCKLNQQIALHSLVNDRSNVCLNTLMSNGTAYIQTEWRCVKWLSVTSNGRNISMVWCVCACISYSILSILR